MNFSQISNRYSALAWTCFLVGLISFVMYDRYEYLKLKRDLHSFFDRGLDHLRIYQNVEMKLDTASSEWVNRVKPMYEDIIRQGIHEVAVHDDLERQKQVQFIYASFGGNHIPLQGYGQVAHAHVPARQNVSGATRAWFVVSDGPSGVSVNIQETKEPDGIHKYVINSIPYHISNGIRSVGYLYQDTNGVKVGYTPLVGITK